MPDTGSLPESAFSDAALAAAARQWRLADGHLPDIAEWRSWPHWIELAWVMLWLLGLAAIVIFGQWEVIPFHLIWISFALLYSWHGHRRLAANTEHLRVSAENQQLLAVAWRWRPAADRNWQFGRLDEVTVSADRERLGLAVDALLENAVQHTKPADAIKLSVIRDDHAAMARLVVRPRIRSRWLSWLKSACASETTEPPA